MKKELQGLYDLCISNGIAESELKPYFATIESNLKTKRYGLVWEEQLEDIAADLKNKFPILVEREDLSIKADPNGLTNCLIEGDNYESLTFLKNSGVKVDCIYIDPPYNTGNQDFVYNDKYIDSEDTWRHSSWLSFMNKRLKLAKELLTEDGVIFISIDDNEAFNLKLLCDSIFGEKNFINNFIWLNNKKGRQTDSFVAKQHEYILTYAKDKQKTKFVELKNEIDDVDVEYTYSDNFSKYKRGVELTNTNSKFNIKTRPNLFYSVYYNPITLEAITKDEKLDDGLTVNIADSKLISDGFIRILPRFRDSNGYGCWRWGQTKFNKDYKQDLIFEKNTVGDFNIFTKSRLNIDNTKSEKIKSILDINGSGIGKQLKLTFPNFDFDFPKPLDLIKTLLKVLNKEDVTVLDFFAGSGTTGHAVLELNKEDNGLRKFILCTNNEVSSDKELAYLTEIGKISGKTKKELLGAYNEFNSTSDYERTIDSYSYQKLGICQAVTYERLSSVISGYTTPKGKEVVGIPSNLKYYKVKNLDTIVNQMEIEDVVIENIVPFIQFKHNIWEKETVEEDLIELKNESESVFVYIKTLYLCDGFYESINNSVKPTTLYIYDGLFEFLDEERLVNVNILSITNEFYKN